MAERVADAEAQGVAREAEMIQVSEENARLERERQELVAEAAALRHVSPYCVVSLTVDGRGNPKLGLAEPFVY
jgi:hypothetical protein